MSLQDIQGGPKIYVKNLKVGRGDLNKHISYRNVRAEMPPLAGRER